MFFALATLVGASADSAAVTGYFAEPGVMLSLMVSPSTLRVAGTVWSSASPTVGTGERHERGVFGIDSA